MAKGVLEIVPKDPEKQHVAFDMPFLAAADAGRLPCAFGLSSDPVWMALAWQGTRDFPALIGCGNVYGVEVTA